MKKWSLRLKVTVLVGTVLVIACLALTAISLYSARGYFGVLGEKNILGRYIERGHTERGHTERGHTERVFRYRRKGETAGGENVIPDDLSLYSLAAARFSNQGVVVMIAAILLSLAAAYCLTGRLLSPLTKLTDSISGRSGKAASAGEAARSSRRGARAGRVLQPYDGSAGRILSGAEKFCRQCCPRVKDTVSGAQTSLQVLEMEEAPGVEDYREFTDAAKAEEAGVTISVSGRCPDVRVEQTLVYRVIFNLVEKAVKYNHPGGYVRITLSEAGGRFGQYDTVKNCGI